MFCENGLINESKMQLNQDEFTEYQWLSPDEALHLYTLKKIPLFPP